MDTKESTLTRVTRKILRNNNGFTLGTDGRQIPIWVPTQIVDDRTGEKWICDFDLLSRRIKPSHGAHITGRYPMGPGRGGSIPFESHLEEQAIALLDMFPELRMVTAQPLTVNCHAGPRRLQYTPDLLAEFSSVPPELACLGFDEITFIEVKPDNLVDSAVRLKATMLEMYTGITTVILTDSQINAALAKGVHYVR